MSPKLASFLTVFWVAIISLSLPHVITGGKVDLQMSGRQIAIRNVLDMETDLLRFYKSWDTLSSEIEKRMAKRAVEACLNNYTANCTEGKRSELLDCIMNESRAVHSQVVLLYNREMREPWQAEFASLQQILLNPDKHSKEALEQAIWTVDDDTISADSVRVKFYLALANFQLPHVAPQLPPPDKMDVYCIDQVFKPIPEDTSS